MLENIINLVKEHAGEAITNNPLIPADKKEMAVQTAGMSIIGGLKQVASEGGIKDIMHLFSGKDMNIMDNPVVGKVGSMFSSDMSSSLGLGAEQAGIIGASLLPKVFTSMITKANDPNDSSIDMQSLFNDLSDGKTSGFNITSIFNKFKSGLDRDGDGDVDLDDLKNAFGNVGNAAGAVVDRVKGIFK